MTAGATASPRVGIALGGGSARGWAHIGVLAGLSENGIEPEVVCGTSIGALVGGIYAAGGLKELEAWVAGLTRRDVLALVDFTVVGGGAIRGRKLLDLYREQLGEPAIEELPRPFAAVATDLETGAEVWLQHGPLHEAIRASISLPGLFVPVRRDGRWLVDGGLVNPVPVSLCRALGADVVIGVDLRSGPAPPTQAEGAARMGPAVVRQVRGTPAAAGKAGEGSPEAPRLPAVLAAALDIMQDRISRSRLAGDPPDLLVTPRVRGVPPLEFAGGGPTIEEGYRAVRRALPALRDLLGMETAD